MPRAKSDNEFQVALKIPSDWVKLADEIAHQRSTPGMTINRTAILREALWFGLQRQQKLFEAKHNAGKEAFVAKLLGDS
jgi:uncharacterized membrane protein